MGPALLRWIDKQVLRWLLAGVRGYRLLLKPWLGNACRFEPTCSDYALQALQSHGAAKGSVLTVGRLLRCHPWCEGGHDPVPQRLFTRLLPTDNPSANSTRNLP